MSIKARELGDDLLDRSAALEGGSTHLLIASGVAEITDSLLGLAGCAFVHCGSDDDACHGSTLIQSPISN